MFRFRRRRYLLSKELQLKYTLIITVICTSITLFLSFHLAKLAQENSNLIYELSDAKKNLLELFGLIPDLNNSLKTKFEEETSITEERMSQTITHNRRLPFFLGLFLLIIIVVVFTGGIIFTHRIVGPMYVFSEYVKQLARGELPEIRKLRKGDEFSAFRDDLALYVREYKHNRINKNDKEMTQLQNVLSIVESHDINRNLAKDSLLALIDEKKKENASLSTNQSQ